MKQIKLKTLTVSLLMVGLSACTLVPGGHIDDVEHTFVDTDANLTAQINAKFVTPDLIEQLRTAEPSAQANPSLNTQIDAYNYIIGKGDVLNITVWDHPELTIPAGQFRSAGESGNVVHADGSIFYPYVGKIEVANKSVQEVRDLIAKRLSKYIEKPQIDVSVAAYRSKRTFVTGEVKQPSVLPITNVPMTLLDALNASGGLGQTADWRSVVLTSIDDNGNSVEEQLDLYALYQKGDMSQNRLIKHNDIIHVPRNDALKVFVMGDVNKPETQRIDRAGLTLAEALNNTGGMSETTADASGIFVLRASQEPNKLVDVYQIDLSNSAMLLLTTRFELQPMDVVYVTSAPVARWNRVIAQLLPTFTSLGQMARAKDDFTN
ncbi:polysaccharide export protein [Thalassotalea aquiviva]|uniref:polysaccharide export protein n=1 Tax=Thalassotalea aquiviva TaxID=3242415 RepID=UPI00352AFF61